MTWYQLPSVVMIISLVSFSRRLIIFDPVFGSCLQLRMWAVTKHIFGEAVGVWDGRTVFLAASLGAFVSVGGTVGLLMGDGSLHPKMIRKKIVSRKYFFMYLPLSLDRF